jgi:hypothetical protein
MSMTLDTRREDVLGKTKNEAEGYGQAGRLDGCRNLQSITQRKGGRRLICRKLHEKAPNSTIFEEWCCLG